MSGDLMELLRGFASRLALGNLLSACAALAVCLLVSRLLLKLCRRLLERTKLEERVRRYILAGAKLVLYVLTAVFAAGQLGVDMTSLVALLSVGSLGVTLAAEDVLGNVAGGLVMLSSHPFTIGDFVEVNGISGTVEEIGLNHTRLVMLSGPLVLLPNKELAASKIINYTVMGRRRVSWTVTASYRAPAEAMLAACRQAMAETPDILPDPAPSACLTGFGEKGAEYTVYCWAAVENYWTVHCTLGERLRSAIEAQGLELSCGQLDVRIVADPFSENKTRP